MSAWGVPVCVMAGSRGSASRLPPRRTQPCCPAHALARRIWLFAYNAHELTETVSVPRQRLLQRVIERRYIRCADVVSVVNESIAQWYREVYPGVDPVVVTERPDWCGRASSICAAAGDPGGGDPVPAFWLLAPGRNIC